MPESSSSIHIYSQPNRRLKNSYSSLSSIEEEQEEKTTEESSPIKAMKPQEASKKVSNGSLASRERGVRYKECRKNHAANIGGYAVDGCREFMAAGEEGTSAALKCAACNCHRNFHKREVEIDGFWDCSSNSTSPRK